MGLFKWLKQRSGKSAHSGPDAEGVYGQLPRGAKWVGPDPIGNPELYTAERSSLGLDLVEWDYGPVIKGIALSRWEKRLVGFGFVFVLSDGTFEDGREIYTRNRYGKLVLESKQKWLVPKGHPTRELHLFSLGEPTNNLVRFVEGCFQRPISNVSAIPINTGIVCEMVILRGLVVPETNRFATRCKVLLGTQSQDSSRYAEFFFNVNSVTKKVWLSEKSSGYQAPILNWMTGQEIKTS